MSSSRNNQNINPFDLEEEFQIYEDNPEVTNEAQNMADHDDDQVSLSQWPGTRFTPINPPRRIVRAGAHTPTPTPADTDAQATPAAPSTQEPGVYFDREVRLRTRTGEVPVREDDFEGTDAWLAPTAPVEQMSSMARYVRQNILIRDARNRVSRRPSAQAPGGVPLGAGARDTSPTPAPRGRPADGPSVLSIAPRRPIQRAPAVPPRPAGARALEEQVRVPPMSVAQLTAQLGVSTMNDFAADGDDEGSGDEQNLNRRRAVKRLPQIPPRPLPRDYEHLFPNSRTVVARPLPVWGRANSNPHGISTYDSDTGYWNVHGFGTGGHRDNGFNPGWAGYHDAHTWSTSVPTFAQPRQVRVQNVEGRHQVGLVEIYQGQMHAEQYPEGQGSVEEEE